MCTSKIITCPFRPNCEFPKGALAVLAVGGIPLNLTSEMKKNPELVYSSRTALRNYSYDALVNVAFTGE